VRVRAMTPWQVFRVIAFIMTEKEAMWMDLLFRDAAFVRVKNGRLERVDVDGGVFHAGEGKLEPWWRT
jgi:hypothetical protein